jgi:hypothetical protein
MKIHINSRQGLYEVERFGRNSIMLSTKHNSFSVPCSDFKSFAGGLWNHSVTKDEMDQFLSVVKPEEYKFQVAQEDLIITLAARLDRIKTDTDFAPIEEIVDEFNYNTDNDYVEDLRKRLAKKEQEVSDQNAKLRDIASRVYSQNLDFSNFQVRNGIKFIIQQDHYDHNLMRFCWDPYGFTNNYHSNISEIYREGDWGTINGGWIKIIGNDVILYGKSGDYGVFDDTNAELCARDVFPTKQIHCFPGQEWDEKLTSMYDDLPF